MKQMQRPTSIATLKPLTDGRVAPIVSHVVGDAVPLAPHPNRHAATKYVNALWDVRWIAWDSWNIALRSASS
jgi:hypothetical protein